VSIPISLSAVQIKKLGRLIKDAGTNVPFYRRRFRESGIDPDQIDIASDFSRIEPLTKSDLLSASPSDLINRRFSSDKLAREVTTGSTGEPFTQLMEPAYVAKRNVRFLRGLMQAGYRPWHRIMLVTETARPGPRYLGRWCYASIGARSADNAKAFLSYRPRVLYGCTTPLRLLAEQLQSANDALPRLRCVISTAEVLDAATRELLETVFRAPVRDFYGLTEMGLVAWQAGRADHYIGEQNSVLIELIPLDNHSGRCRLLMTNLDLFAAPLIRYETGDIAITSNGRITGFEGRELDVLTSSDGERISPYSITTRIQKLDGLRRFKLIETAVGAFTLRIEADSDWHASISHDASSLLEELIGNDIRLDIQFTDQLIPEGTRKFRTIESRVPKGHL